MSGRFDGKVALVTGGCSGIGLATVERFVAEGARVLVADMQDEKGAMLERRFAGKVAYRHCDVTQEADIAAAVQAAGDSFGGLDILVNNAGTGGTPLGALDMTCEGWDATFALLLRGPMLGIKHAAPLMIARGGGAVVNIASIAGKEGNPNASAYSASKAAVIALTKSLGKELADTGVRVNCVTPAAVKTAIFDQMKPEFIQFMLSKIPMGRFGTPEEVAAMVTWLSTEDCSFSTGAVFDLSGGRSTY